MSQATTRPPRSEAEDRRPLDVTVMRASARRLFAEDAELPSPKELETLTLQLRGHIMLAIPEVATVAAKLPEDDIPRACALACIGEARMRLGLEPGRTLPAGIAHAQRLARSVNALVDHFENLGGGRETAVQAALRRLGEHCASCRTCMTVNEAGENANVPCEVGARLYEEWRQARRGGAATVPLHR
ncbi:DUF6415 family natural product biosynthesis protein [Streptomyces sp. NPDC059866]|uniref:DUF6415 family natural product biosynthesis protein n=1 Tax=Streptomyces sp. NPDC059866 TaxID=3346978 RepID=UPI00364F499F